MSGSRNSWLRVSFCRENTFEYIFGRILKNCSVYDMFDVYANTSLSPKVFVRLERDFENFLINNSFTPAEFVQGEKSLQSVLYLVLTRPRMFNAQNSEQQNEKIFLKARFTFYHMKLMIYRKSIQIVNSAHDISDLVSTTLELVLAVTNGIDRLLTLNCLNKSVDFIRWTCSVLRQNVPFYNAEADIYITMACATLALCYTWTLCKLCNYDRALEILVILDRGECLEMNSEFTSQILLYIGTAYLEHQLFNEAANYFSIAFLSTVKIPEVQNRDKKLLYIAYLLFSAYLKQYPNEFIAEEIFEGDTSQDKCTTFYPNLIDAYQMTLSCSLSLLMDEQELRSADFTISRQIVIALWRMYIAAPRKSVLEALIPKSFSLESLFEVVENLIKILDLNYIIDCAKLFFTVLYIFKTERNLKYCDVKIIYKRLRMLTSSASEAQNMDLLLVWELFTIKILVMTSDITESQFRVACRCFAETVFKMAFFNSRNKTLEFYLKVLLHNVEKSFALSEMLIKYSYCHTISDIPPIAGITSSTALDFEMWNAALWYIYHYINSSDKFLTQDDSYSTEKELPFKWKPLFLLIKQSCKRGGKNEYLKLLIIRLSLFLKRWMLYIQNPHSRERHICIVKLSWCFHNLCFYMGLQMKLDKETRFLFLSLAVHFEDIMYSFEVRREMTVCLTAAISCGIKLVRREPNIDIRRECVMEEKASIQFRKGYKFPFRKMNTHINVVQLFELEAALLSGAPNCYSLYETALDPEQCTMFLEIIAKNLRLYEKRILNMRRHVFRAATALMPNSGNLVLERIDRSFHIISQACI